MVCEKCWAKAHLIAITSGKSQYECYIELLQKNQHKHTGDNVMNLRNDPKSALTVEAVRAMLREKDLFDSDWNQDGKGLPHEYELAANGVVIDHATGLMWQQGGSGNWMKIANAKNYVQELNRTKFAGFSDWRLPTLEEAMSLIEPSRKNGDLYINPVFDKRQRWIWTADKLASGVAWYVDFRYGYCSTNPVYNSSSYVRAVRSGQS